MIVRLFLNTSFPVSWTTQPITSSSVLSKSKNLISTGVNFVENLGSLTSSLLLFYCFTVAAVVVFFFFMLDTILAVLLRLTS